MARTNNTQANGEALTFAKDQLVQSKKYIHRRDALNALLDGGKSYSFAEVDNILKQFDEGGKA
ncbi:hypothetical protein [Lysinibacillus xylanilyticus]|uniref:hypothetical protein n=1 Tax=Lysinibacillus xylanilyticus TaxID=582475 RepID=UPI003CFEAAE0